MKAAARGHAGAQYNLGALYHNGEGVPQDFTMAREWYEKAASQGDADAQYNLAVLCEGGHGVAKNLPRARDLYRRAASQGHEEAATELERFVHDQVMAGRYRSEDEVIRDALEQLRRQAQTPPAATRMTEAEFKQHLLESGRISSLPTPADSASRPVFQPIALQGEPLSETIIRERR